MIIKKLFVAVAVSCTVFAPSFSRAEDGFTCLPQTKGRTVLWDREWQADGEDHNVPYTVSNYEERIVRGEPKQHILTLRAKGSAKKAERTATIVKTIAAEFFCKRIHGGLADRNKGVLAALGGRDAARASSYEISSVYPSQDLHPEQLSFRRWNGTEWAPAVPEPDERKYICYTKTGPVACAERDYDAVKAGIPKMPPVVLELPGPMLRHFESGWARGEPIGDYEESEITQCPLFGKNFYCLTEEKNKWGQELKELEKDLALLEEMNPLPLPEPVRPRGNARKKRK